MEVISIANQKGGCGKTTLAVNISAALAKLGHETLLIDLDPQAHATFAMGFSNEASDRKTFYDIFRNHFNNFDTEFEEIIITGREKFSFIPANMMLSAAEINLGNMDGAATILYRTLLHPYFERYKYVIIDSPPSFGFLTLNSMYAADIILAPMDLSYFSFNGINGVYRVASLLNRETGRKPLIFFALNSYDRRSKCARKIEHNAVSKLGDYLLQTRIRSSVRLREAAGIGKTIFEYDEKSSAALDFSNLTRELLSAGKKKTNTVMQEFLFHAPEAGAVYILGDFNNWQKSEVGRMTRLESGHWSGHVTLRKGKYRYKFLVDDEWIHDPENSKAESNTFGTHDSILKV